MNLNKMVITVFVKQMKKYKVTRKELANAVGVSPTTMTRILNEKTDLKYDMFLNIANALGLKVTLEGLNDD